MAIELGVVFGIGIVVGLMFMLFDRLDPKEHFLLRLLIVFLNITLILFIPLHLLDVNVLNLFYRLYLYFVVLFWTYVSVALFVWIMRKWGFIMPKKFKGEKI